MNRHSTLLLTLLFTAACASAPTGESKGQSKDLWLLPEDSVPEQERGKGIFDCKVEVTAEGDGPIIELVAPQLNTEEDSQSVEAPFDLEVSFRERGKAIDLNSLDVRASCLGRTRNLSEDIREFATAAGIRKEAVKVPFGGCYRIEVSISDVEGKRSTSSYRTRIKKS